MEAGAGAGAAAATISPSVQAGKPPPSEQGAPFPARQGVPATMPAPSATPATSAASMAHQMGARSAATAPQAEPGHQQENISKKRKLEKAELQNSPYFKIRGIVRDLRPSFVRVLHAPDFRSCHAAEIIRKQMKVLLDLCKQLKTDVVTPASMEAVEGHPPLASRKESTDARIKVEKQDVPVAAEEVVISEAKLLEQQLREPQGTYVVGGSPMGWNFLVYRGGEPVYYGVTKEAARRRMSLVT